MKTKTICLSIIKIFIYLSLTCSISSAQHPEQPTGYYGSDYPLLPSGSFRAERTPDVGLFFVTYDYNGRPLNGYPGSPGLVDGINDTTYFTTYLKNRSSSSFTLTSENPEDWVMPKIYANYGDVTNDYPEADTSDFEFEFVHFSNSNPIRGIGGFPNPPISKPASLDSGDVLVIIYRLWDVPLGSKLVLFEETVDAHDSLHVVKRPAGYWGIEPKTLSDTLNGYAGICDHLYFAGDRSGMTSWADTILAHNDSSLVGWYWKAMAYERMATPDSTNAALAYGRIITIMNYNNDPAIDVSTHHLPFPREIRGIEAWRLDITSLATWKKFIMESGYNLGTR